jgi:hypothetical protein
MIHGFFDIVQQDIAYLRNFTAEIQKKDQKEEVASKVNIAAGRCFMASIMALSVMMGLFAFRASTAIDGLLKLATAVSFYVLSHDVFVMLTNSEKGPLGQALAVGQGILADLQDLWNGNKTLEDVPRHYLTQGTFLRPMWDMAFAQE